MMILIKCALCATSTDTCQLIVENYVYIVVFSYIMELPVADQVGVVHKIKTELLETREPLDGETQMQIMHRHRACH